MPSNIILDGMIAEDLWQVVDKDAIDVPEGLAIIPQALWNSNKASFAQRKEIGVWLDSEEPPQLIADDLENFSLIAINFGGFMDGRGFSYARELREAYNFKGEIRAIGSFLRDQLFYLKRCGFNSFALKDTDQEEALASLEVFSDSYQAGADQPIPLFSRRED
ncbi:MAG: hypothetical protein ACI92E_000869 [Oceanicoccus sp.]|jgi:uncharacterized protein (DUF934 family)